MPTEEQLDLAERLVKDPRFYARYTLKVKPKEGGPPVDFNYNKAQDYLHARWEDQKRRTGMVRRVGVKGRQQGFSELVQGRFFHAAHMVPYTSIYVLAHEVKATKILFGKAQRYLEHMAANIRPETPTNNAGKIVFANKSDYELGTANNESTGRSGTFQKLHLSEPAHYEDGCEEGLRSGLLQTVADMYGTEIIWETTCNGHNWFYQFYLDVVAGKTEYEFDFVPWYWTPEYRRLVPSEFRLEDEEKTLMSIYGIDMEQIYWRRLKIANMKSLRLFRQEYPFTPEEAFQASGGAFFDPDTVQAARNSRLTETDGPLILGCDPGRTGDRTVIALRKGRRILWLDKYTEMDQPRLAGILGNYIHTLGVTKCFVDAAYGDAVVDLLKKRNMGHIVEAVSFASSADDAQYANKRAEMHFSFREWLTQYGEVRLPDDADMAADIGMISDFKLNHNGKKQMPAKDEIRKVHKRSPDILDAIILTFAYPVGDAGQAGAPGSYTEQYQQHSQTHYSNSELTTARYMSGSEDGSGYAQTTEDLIAEAMRRIGRH